MTIGLRRIGLSYPAGAVGPALGDELTAVTHIMTKRLTLSINQCILALAMIGLGLGGGRELSQQRLHYQRKVQFHSEREYTWAHKAQFIAVNASRGKWYPGKLEEASPRCDLATEDSSLLDEVFGLLRADFDTMLRRLGATR